MTLAGSLFFTFTGVRRGQDTRFLALLVLAGAVSPFEDLLLAMCRTRRRRLQNTGDVADLTIGKKWMARARTTKIVHLNALSRNAANHLEFVKTNMNNVWVVVTVLEVWCGTLKLLLHVGRSESL
jgi:hypothetical protein